jgi:hypothetical protein
MVMMMIKMMMMMVVPICHMMAPEGIMIAPTPLLPIIGREGEEECMYLLPTVCLSIILPVLVYFDCCCTDDRCLVGWLLL